VSALITATQTFGDIIGDLLSNSALSSYIPRSIGSILPHVVVEESHRDELTMTQHPVEVGCPPTDHAFMQPFTVEIRGGFSNSTAQSEGYVQAAYQTLLAMQSSMIPLDISTGKRQYTSMLIKSIAVRTDEESENVLNFVAFAQQLVTTSTSSTSASATTGLTNNQIPAATANTDGTFTTTGGAAPVNSSDATPLTVGSYTFGTDVAPQGSQILVPADAGAPTVESLTAQGGV
jgi:hypothetical protein